jgi:anthranilate synthase component 1
MQVAYHPTLEEVERLAGQGNLVPVYREINADMETPVSAYLKVARRPFSFLLESVEGGERIARYSFIGTEPYAVIKTGPGQSEGAVDPLLPVQQALEPMKVVEVPNVGRFNGGAVGYLSYEAADYFERLPSPESDPLGLPESVFMLTITFLIFDHVSHKIRIVSHAQVDGDVERGYLEATKRIDELAGRLERPVALPKREAAREGDSRPREVASNMTREEYDGAVGRIVDYIHAGDCIQVVFSQRFSRATDAAPFDIYRALRGINPSPYMFYLELDDFHVVGASPEMLVRCVDGRIDYHPIAGTRPRGRSSQEDLAMEEELRESEKERAEHIMLVDLGRNDVGRVSVPGSVKVTQFMEVERYSHVMHLVSHLTGELKPELNCYETLRSCFPAGTLSGAPKIRAMEIIAELEPDRRGAYAGAAGYFTFSGNMDTAILLRTMVVKDGVAHVQAGGGIVADSKADQEYQETVDKARALMRAIDDAEEGT